MWSPNPQNVSTDCEKWWQYSTKNRAEIGPAGMTQVDFTELGRPVNSLEWRDGEGVLRGIINYYPKGLPASKRAGEVQLNVDPSARRQGIGMSLVKEAIRLWDIQAKKQRYNTASAGLTESWLEEYRSKKEIGEE
jgi:GNAT superfamily N-acetyltransferase